MQFVRRSILSSFEKIEVIDLWNNEYPENLQHKTTSDFDKYLENLTTPSHILLIDNNNKIKGWYFDFIRENEKWFVLILDSQIQKKGLGTKTLNLAKEKENILSGWVIDHNTDKKKKWRVLHVSFIILS